MTATLRRTYLVPRELEEHLTAWLAVTGTLGTQTFTPPGGGDSRRLEAYFALPAPDSPQIPGVELVAEEELPGGDDWLRRYREVARPVTVGHRLRIDPREPEAVTEAPETVTEVPEDGRVTLRIPARNAFGTGSHESTRLVLEILETLEPKGLRVLDVGAGSGILSFAACLFGAATVIGVEIDVAATLVAGQNRRLNGLYPALVVGGLDSLAPVPRLDLALVNILPERFLPFLGLLPPLLVPGATAVFSGIIEAREAEVVERLREHGFEVVDRRRDGEWRALRCRLRR